MDAAVEEASWAREGVAELASGRQASAVADYEGELGQITDEEIAVVPRRDRESAVVVRGRGPWPRGGAGSTGKGAA